LYYSCPDAARLTECLGDTGQAGRTEVCDVFTPPERVAEFDKMFAGAGFVRHACFLRYQRMAAATAEDVPECPQIVLAHREQAGAMVELLRRNFDPLAEHLPDRAEVESLLAAGRGWQALGPEGQMAGILLHDQQGVTTTLRFLLVLPGFQGQGYGHRLLRRYLGSVVEARRFLLWVNESNNRARRLYESHGYAQQPLTDAIYRR
jgi:ribosomal protein S18 acetylase RimI-like enzyme